MNLTDHFVTKVLGEPYENYGKWWVRVMSVSWGHDSENTIMCNTKEETLEVKKGTVFLA